MQSQQIFTQAADVSFWFQGYRKGTIILVVRGYMLGHDWCILFFLTELITGSIGVIHVSFGFKSYEQDQFRHKHEEDQEYAKRNVQKIYKCSNAEKYCSAKNNNICSAQVVVNPTTTWSRPRWPS